MRHIKDEEEFNKFYCLLLFVNNKYISKKYSGYTCRLPEYCKDTSEGEVYNNEYFLKANDVLKVYNLLYGIRGTINTLFEIICILFTLYNIFVFKVSNLSIAYIILCFIYGPSCLVISIINYMTCNINGIVPYLIKHNTRLISVCIGSSLLNTVFFIVYLLMINYY